MATNVAHFFGTVMQRRLQVFTKATLCINYWCELVHGWGKQATRRDRQNWSTFSAKTANHLAKARMKEAIFKEDVALLPPSYRPQPKAQQLALPAPLDQSESWQLSLALMVSPPTPTPHATERVNGSFPESRARGPCFIQKVKIYII